MLLSFEIIAYNFIVTGDIKTSCNNTPKVSYEKINITKFYLHKKEHSEKKNTLLNNIFNILKK